jgi:hypothetical protein
MLKASVYIWVTALLLSTNVVQAQMCIWSRYVSYSEQISSSDAVILCQVTAPAVPFNVRHKHRMKIEDIMVDKLNSFEQSQIFEYECEERYKPGNLILLMGSKSDDDKNQIKWISESLMTTDQYRYLANLPPAAEPTNQRILYYLSHLCSDNPKIARDAYIILQDFPLLRVAEVSLRLSAESVRHHLKDHKTHVYHYHWYPLRLHKDGTIDDTALLQKLIQEKIDVHTDESHGLIAGYLLLSVENAGNWLDTTYINQPAPNFVHSYHVLNSFDLVLSLTDDSSTRNRVLDSAHQMLSDENLAQLVITKLAHWQDWSIAENLCTVYDDVDKKDVALRGSIMTYLLAYQADHHEEVSLSKTDRLVNEKLHEIRRKHPNLYRLRAKSHEIMIKSEQNP